MPGLRREEVATLAAISVDYYARMERGDLRGVSPEILDAVARALRLDEAETDHATSPAPRDHRPSGAVRVATTPSGPACSASSTPSPAPPYG